MLLKDYFPDLQKKYHKLSFKGIAFNSTEVKKGYIFFALKGNITDGNLFIIIEMTDILIKAIGEIQQAGLLSG